MWSCVFLFVYRKSEDLGLEFGKLGRRCVGFVSFNEIDRIEVLYFECVKLSLGNIVFFFFVSVIDGINRISFYLKIGFYVEKIDNSKFRKFSVMILCVRKLFCLKLLSKIEVLFFL